LRPIFNITDQNFRVDDRIISVRLVVAQKPEGRHCFRLEIRLHQIQPRVVRSGGLEFTVFPCQRSWGPNGPTPTKWNCANLGIEGPRTDLPVFIDKHAVTRLHERLRLTNHVSLLHLMMVESLESPVFYPADHGRYLVEARLGRHRVGYFVAEV